MGKVLNYWTYRCVIPGQRYRWHVLGYYTRRKYILLTDVFIYTNWYNVLKATAFVNINFYVRFSYFGIFRWYVRPGKDLWFIKHCFIKKYVRQDVWKVYRRNRSLNVNVIVKILWQVKCLRREWHKLMLYRLKKFRAGLMYNLLYRKFHNNSFFHLFGVYMMVMGSKFLITVRWYKIYELLYKYLNKYQSTDIHNRLYYIGLSKWYLVYWIRQWRVVKYMQLYHKSIRGKRKFYLWQLYDVAQYVEVDYFTFTSFKLPLSMYLCLMCTHLFVYFHWEFVNVYNWKHFY